MPDQPAPAVALAVLRARLAGLQPLQRPGEHRRVRVARAQAATAQQIAAADAQVLKSLGMPLKRAQALITLAEAACDGTFPLQRPDDVEQGVKALMNYPGIGRWTANYFALRGWQAKDIFLADDYAIKQRFAGMTPAQTRRYAERWQPFRSYALLHIWFTQAWSPEP